MQMMLTGKALKESRSAAASSAVSLDALSGTDTVKEYVRPCLAVSLVVVVTVGAL